MFKGFCIGVVEEWKGWVTGSLPMAVVAVIGLIKPDIVPLPLWAWVVLIFGAGFVCAVFRVYRSAKLECGELQKKLDVIALDRPLAYYTGNFNFDAGSLAAGKISLRAWGIFIENLSDRMLKYTITDFWLEDSKRNRFISKPVPDHGGFISAKTRMTYSLVSDDDSGMFLGNGIGTQWTIGFTIEYDNIPPLKNRIMEHKIQFTLTSLIPMQTGNTILFRDER